jgi:hypothetical protein
MRISPTELGPFLDEGRFQSPRYGIRERELSAAPRVAPLVHDLCGRVGGE